VESELRWIRLSISGLPARLFDVRGECQMQVLGGSI
jgi:hypothetical protein